VEPTLEIGDLVVFEFHDQLLEHLHGGIFAFLLVAQVLEAHAVHQVQVAVVQVTQYPQIFRLPVTVDEFLVSGWLFERKTPEKHRPQRSLVSLTLAGNPPVHGLILLDAGK
jgi:hypothetical protein